MSELPARGVVDVWLADLTSAGGDEGDLDAGERARAARYAREVDRARFVARRTVLRRLLATYLGIRPHEVDVSRPPAEKPALAAASGRAPQLRFSTSSSGDVAVVAVTSEAEIGVDVVPADAADDLAAIIAERGSACEVRAFRALAPAARAAAAVAWWSKKEAFVKAIGRGLRYPLDAFDVTVDPLDDQRIVAIRDPAFDARAWALCTLTIPPNLTASIVTRGPEPPRLHVRPFPP